MSDKVKPEKPEMPMVYGGFHKHRTPERLASNYPQGDGHVGCPHCHGRGVVIVPEERRPPFCVGEVTEACKCIRLRDTLDNLNRAWKGLSKIKPVDESSLVDYTEQDLWITSAFRDTHDLKAEMARIGRTMGPSWFFRVITDIDMMTTWLYSANEVLDPDVAVKRTRAENQHSRLTDLVEPPDLLVIRLGAKAARNVAAPEVFLECLLHRDQMDKPTWVVDTITMPLEDGHISYDLRVGDHLSDWDTFDLSGGRKVKPGQIRDMSLPASSPRPTPSTSDSSLGGGDRYQPMGDQIVKEKLVTKKSKPRGRKSPKGKKK